MVSRSTVTAFVCCWLLLSTPLAAVVGAQTANTTANGSSGSTPSANACFPGEGYEFTIGTEGPQIEMVLHLSMLTNLGGPGAIGIELAGSIDGPPIIELDYRFELPMFGPSYDYEDSDAPIEGPVGDANCTFVG